ncbi:AMP-binding protein [Roseibium salinum]|nr:AMP-binding protein [Roseibium salinum]
MRSWDRGNADLSGLGLRLMIAGGEVLAPEVVEAWSRCGLSRIRLVNAYGPTEATVTALVHTVKPGMKERNIPIGRPLPGTEVYILDREGNLVPDGVVGELHLGGDRLAIGYHGCEDVTAAKFRDHAVGPKVIRLYATGDLACFRPNSGGVIEFRGRIDDQVKNPRTQSGTRRNRSGYPRLRRRRGRGRHRPEQGWRDLSDRPCGRPMGHM